MTIPELQLSGQIPGDVLAGFSSERAHFFFINFDGAVDVHDWLRELVPELAFTDDVAAYHRNGQTNDVVWRALSLTIHGIRALSPSLARTFDGISIPAPVGTPARVVSPFSQAYKDGPAQRAGLLGDIGASDPSTWKFGGPGQMPVHALLTLAANDATTLSNDIDNHRIRLTAHHIDIVFEEPRNVVVRLPGQGGGHEDHFGFREGIRQPGVRDFDEPDPSNPSHVQGQPNRPFVDAGEFVLGKPLASLVGGSPTLRVRPIPEALFDGSFQVVRRLHQDVAAWNRQVRTQAVFLGLTDAQFGGKLIGRYRDGKALHFDPGGPSLPPTATPKTEPAIDFPGGDRDALRTPRFAHTRTMYPGTDHSDISKRRIIRRGISYGPKLGDPDPEIERGEVDDGKERGIYFIAYMSNIREQFECLQGRFANSRGTRRGGVDPLVGAGPTAHSLPTAPGTASPFDFARCVQTTGAIYAFSPSRETLERIADGNVTFPDPKPREDAALPVYLGQSPGWQGAAAGTSGDC